MLLASLGCKTNSNTSTSSSTTPQQVWDLYALEILFNFNINDSWNCSSHWIEKRKKLMWILKDVDFWRTWVFHDVRVIKWLIEIKANIQEQIDECGVWRRSWLIISKYWRSYGSGNTNSTTSFYTNNTSWIYSSTNNSSSTTRKPSCKSCTKVTRERTSNIISG